MPNNEQTQAKNLDNLRTAISILQSIGSLYSPSKVLIEISELVKFATGFDDRMQAINAVLPAEELAVNQRMAGFKPVAARTTKILNAAKGQGLEPEEIADLRTSANAIRGIRVTPKTPDDPNTPLDQSKKSISSSNRSYAGILESLDLFVEQLKGFPGYNPNETEYQTATLDAWVSDLKTKNQTAIDAKGPTRAARNDRNSFAYSDTTGLLVRTRMMKNYVRSILPTSDTRYIQLNRLKFTDFGG